MRVGANGTGAVRIQAEAGWTARGRDGRSRIGALGRMNVYMVRDGKAATEVPSQGSDHVLYQHPTTTTRCGPHRAGHGSNRPRGVPRLGCGRHYSL